MAKFGIDSNMVFDADGKSVATRLSDHDTSLDSLSSSLAESTNDNSYTLGFLNGLNDIRTRTILEVNGFYSVDDGSEGKYRVLAVTGSETWTDIKDTNNNILFQSSSTGEIKAVNASKKLKVMIKNDYDVKLFGAKGNGIADDTIAIQNTINAVKPTGGKVLVPKGRYLISSSLIVPSYLTLDGVGEKSEIFTQTNTLTLIITETNAEKVVVRNLKVSGNGTGSQPANTIDAPNVTNAGCGIVFIGVNKGLIENCIVDNCGGNGLNGNNGIAGIYLTYGCHDCIVTKNRVTNCRNGINEDNFFCPASKDAQNNLYSQNYIDGCRFGIATDCYLNAKGCQIINNNIRNCMYTAIDVNKTSQVLIKGNWIEGNGNTQQVGVYSTAINIYGNSDGSVNPQNCIVEGNMLINNYYHGIKITNNSYYISVLNNQILGGSNTQAGATGILIQASRYPTIKGNIIESMTGTGIYANPLTINSIVINVDKAIIEGNQIKGNQRHGIYMEATSYTIISNNRVDGNALEAANTYNGITLTSGSVNNALNGNVVTGTNHKYGIGLLDSGTISNVIGDNILIGNAQNLGLASTNNFLNGNARNSANEFTLQSANGTRYKVTVSDVGAISATQVS
jgi:parallel beta-helix repeat protein